MTNFREIIEYYRNNHYNKKDKGLKFERLIKTFLKTDEQYKTLFSDVWLWNEWEGNDNQPDTGIDIVAKEYDGSYWAIQCKFYDKGRVDKKDIDKFIAVSGKHPFSKRMIVSTTQLGKNAENVIKDQQIPISQLSIDTIQNSLIDWSKFIPENPESLTLKPKNSLRDYQQEALENVIEEFKTNDRGKLIMACGTGKTITGLRITEEILKNGGSAIVLAPSIALISQNLREWTAQSTKPMKFFVVCSDSKVGIKDEDYSISDLAYPSTTNSTELLRQIENTKKQFPDALIVIFCTYQSIDTIIETNLEFEIAICDEAHRTVGTNQNTAKREDQSYFTKIHSNDYIRAKKRLYMTATPKIYSESLKTKADEASVVLYSMDDEIIFGKEFYSMSFRKAIDKGILSDYKIVILIVDENEAIIKFKFDSNKIDEASTADKAKLIGCQRAINKIFTNDSENEEENIDKTPMKSIVSFTNTIKDSEDFVKLIKSSRDILAEGVEIIPYHVDGRMGIAEREKYINILKNPEENKCVIVSNAKCLSEGIDVPALDGIIFTQPRDSQIDVVQAVGRVMRKSKNKKTGYIIIPVVNSVSDTDETIALNLSKGDYKTVWSAINALKSHDEDFKNEIDNIEIGSKPKHIDVIGKKDKVNTDILQNLEFDFGSEIKNIMFSKILKQTRDPEHWEEWAGKVALLVGTYKNRINNITANNANIKEKFDSFIKDFKKNVNENLNDADIVDMLSQHLVLKPVFDALFQDYDFSKKNPMSVSMQQIIDELEKYNLHHEKGNILDTEEKVIEEIEKAIKLKSKGLITLDSKQKFIIKIYEKFFSVALKKTADKLGIVYTPIEIVDFIINSVQFALQKEFNQTLNDKGVHILDPFTGTGTFITRLLQSGLITDIERKYNEEIHANEIVLLAYYIATINIEETYHSITNNEYKPFDGIVLTDTFAIKKNDQLIFENMGLKENNKRIEDQEKLDIRVIISNPPYSARQESQNDNNKNESYPELDAKIVKTYVKNSASHNKNSLHDSYIKAFRWATDRIESDGIICFVSNGSYINGKTFDGFRKSLSDEFTSVYCFNLRGDARTKGEQRRKEKGNIFGSGSRTSIAITLLIKNSAKINNCKIFYYDIGDYLSREDKLNIIHNFNNINSIEWQEIIPDNSGDWIKQRNIEFLDFIPMCDKQNKNAKKIFNIYSMGIVTARDSWCYNFSKEKLENNIKSMINFYNSEVDRYSNAKNQTKNIDNFVDNDTKKISWTRGLKKRLKNKKTLEFNADSIVRTMYRPFCEQWLYYNGTRELNEEISQIPQIFPDKNSVNTIIYVSGLGDKPFSSIIINNIPDLNMQHSSGQGFPLYYYEKNNKFKKVNPSEPSELKEISFLEPEDEKENFDDSEYTRRDNISNEFLKEIQDKYNDANITKEDIFYYIYGILNSPDYKATFANDLTKMLPRIPFISEFKKFSKAGRDLAELHLNYEIITPYPITETISDNAKDLSEDKLYRVEKMKFARNGKEKDKTVIIYNDYITLSDIPADAYNFIVNGKSAIEWIMDKYQVSIHKESQIKNDPNDYLEEIQDYKYIINLIKRLVYISIQSVNIINKLPKINF